MQLYVIPSSGGRFPNQLAYLKILGNIGIKPDLVLSCSGGNICAYTAMFANWNIEKKSEMILQTIYNMAVVESWIPPAFNFIPNAVMLTTKGSIFKNFGDQNTFMRLFTKDNIKRTEIWTSAYNRLHDKIECFCNLHKSECYIRKDVTDENMVLENKYLDGDIEKIYQVGRASASIPSVFPQIWIDNVPYSDGGVASASPLGALGPAIQDIMRNQSVHFVYMNPRSIIHERPYQGNSALSNILITYHNTTRFNTFSEEIMIKSMLAGYGNIEYKYIENATQKDVIEWEKTKKNYKHSFIEWTPRSIRCLNLLNFDRSEIADMMDETSKNFSLRMWWVVSSTNE